MSEEEDEIMDVSEVEEEEDFEVKKKTSKKKKTAVKKSEADGGADAPQAKKVKVRALSRSVRRLRSLALLFFFARF